MQGSSANNSALPIEERYHPGKEVYRRLHEESLENPEKFWNEHAGIIEWYRRWEKVLDDSNPPFYRWFVSGKLNLSYNCLDRNIKNHRRNKAAYIWIAEDGTEKIVTYRGLHKRVNVLAAVLRDLGIQKGDRIVIYLPMLLEAPVAMLAAARIGAPFSFVFAGYGASALSERIRDSGAKLVITSDGGFRGGKVVELKKVVDEALQETTSVENVIVVKRTGTEVDMVESRDLWYHDLVADRNDYVEPEVMDSNDPLYILYTSGTTGKPKGVVHGTGGYAVWVANTLEWAFGPTEDDRWWCAADVGWVTGHSYIVFAPLILGLTSIMYEGSIIHPGPDRLWKIVQDYAVNLLYTSPTAIRTLMRYGVQYARMHDLSSLRVLGSVGEPINPAAWQWYYTNIGKDRCPIIDTYWQTETGGFVMAPANGISLPLLKPGSVTFPMPGIDPVIYGEEGAEVKPGEKGYFAIRKPWPGMFLTLNNDPDRFRSAYFDKFNGAYYSGDFAIRDQDGYYWLLGRADEVLNVSGHRLGTIEIEDAIITSEEVAETAVFGKPDPVRGESIVAFVVVKDGFTGDLNLGNAIKGRIRETLGPIYIPHEIHFVSSLPKTRSGKIMRRVVKAVALNQVPGDISTLENSVSVDEIRDAIEEFRKESG